MYQNNEDLKSARKLAVRILYVYILLHNTYMTGGSMSVEDDVFDHHYDVTMKYLNEQSQKEDFSIDLVKAELVSLTKYEGLDWTGRGLIKEAEISGAILAYQAFIMRWENAHQ
jgi:hypothetical protein